MLGALCARAVLLARAGEQTGDFVSAQRGLQRSASDTCAKARKLSAQLLTLIRLNGIRAEIDPRFKTEFLTRQLLSFHSVKCAYHGNYSHQHLHPGRLRDLRSS